jgi:hypothetical protein
MSTLREKLIRLAHNNKEARPHLLPLLRKEATGLPIGAYRKMGDSLGTLAQQAKEIRSGFFGSSGPT